MADLIYGIASYAMSPLASIGFILIVFLISPRMQFFWRAFLASFLGCAIIVGPGLYYNLRNNIGMEPSPVFYFGIYWIPSLLISCAVSWVFAKRLHLKPSQIFE